MTITSILGGFLSLPNKSLVNSAPFCLSLSWRSLPPFPGLVAYPFVEGLSDLWFGGAEGRANPYEWRWRILFGQIIS